MKTTAKNFTVKIQHANSSEIQSIHLTATSKSAAITSVLASHGPAKVVEAYRTY
jgi:hypothetical protein